MNKKVNQRDAQKLGARLRRAREKLGFTQQQMADLIGCARLHWLRIESGRAIPNWEEMLEFSLLFRIPVQALYYEVPQGRTSWRATPQSQAMRRWLGAKLQLVRKANGVSRERLAQTLGCSLNRIYLVEHGKGVLNALEARRVCELLGIEPLALYSGDPRWDPSLR